MTQGLGLDEIINITTTVQSGGTIRSEFGTGLLMTEDDSIAAGGAGKCQYFRNLAAVSAVFDDAAVIHDAGVWFGADPAPKPLYIGRWAREAVNTKLISGVVDLTASTIAGYTDGSYRLNGVDDTGITFAGNSDFTAISGTLATAISTIADTGTATVTYSSTSKRFTIDFGTPTNLGFFSESTTNVGTDLSDVFKLTEAGGARIIEGSAAEDLSQAVTKCIALASAGAPTALMLNSGITSPYTNSSSASTNVNTEMRTYAQAGDFMFSFVDSTSGALTTGEETSSLYSAFSLGQNKVIPVYSRATLVAGESFAPRPDIGILAKLSSQNFDLPASIITLQPKVLPNVGTTTVDSTQKEELFRKRANVYTTVGGLPTLLGGTAAKTGVWADAQWWLLWLKNEMEKTIFEAQRSSKRLSNGQLVDAIGSVMTKAVRSGGAKPGGKVNNNIRDAIRATTGNQEFDGIMQNGFVMWVEPPQMQTDADRAARISRFTVWVAPSDAIHEVGGAIILSG